MRNKNSTIKIKNKLPELLEAVCNHKDCPEWLQDGIWDLFGNQHHRVTFTANYWRSQFESMFEREPVLDTVDDVADALDAEVMER
jgi:hypothetical protein